MPAKTVSLAWLRVNKTDVHGMQIEVSTSTLS
jgi:hypothetical protein